MTKNTFTFTLLFVLMVFLQIICNRICLFDIAVPFAYIYFILRLPLTLSSNWVMTLSFLIGLTVDIFSNTHGMNALGCTIIGALRHPIITLFFSREDEMSNPIPSTRTLGIGNYLKYILSLTFIFCVCIYLIQMFTFNNVLLMISRILGSTILTAIVLFGFDCIATARREKRL